MRYRHRSTCTTPPSSIFQLGSERVIAIAKLPHPALLRAACLAGLPPFPVHRQGTENSSSMLCFCSLEVDQEDFSRVCVPQYVARHQIPMQITVLAHCYSARLCLLNSLFSVAGVRKLRVRHIAVSKQHHVAQYSNTFVVLRRLEVDSAKTNRHILALYRTQSVIHGGFVAQASNKLDRNTLCSHNVAMRRKRHLELDCSCLNDCPGLQLL